MKTPYLSNCSLAVVLILCSNLLLAQATFKKTFGGSRMDYGHALCKTSDGGFMLAGQTFSYGDTTSDSWLVKTDAYGNFQWMKSMGSDTLDGANSVEQAADGGYFVVNHTEGYGAGDCDAWMYKTDASGNILWQHTYGSPYDDVGESGIVTSDGSYLAVGVEAIDDWRGNAFIAKYTSNGDVDWIKNYGGPQGEVAKHVVELTDGNYVAAGTLFDTLGSSDVFIFKTDSAGNLLWSKTAGDAGREEVYGFCQCTDGGFAVCGKYVDNVSHDTSAFLLKTDADGNEQWQKTFGGPAFDVFYSVVSSSDGSLAAAGQTNSFSDPSDVFLVKTDDNGNQQWIKTFGDSNHYSTAMWMALCTDGGYAVSGSQQPVASDDGDMLFLKTDANGSFVNVNAENFAGNYFYVYPSPAKNSLNISSSKPAKNAMYKIYDATGKVVLQTGQVSNIDISGLSAGVYDVRMLSDGNTYSASFVKY